jgi:vacuolar-type H+-ATPase subunit F/Vma7
MAAIYKPRQVYRALKEEISKFFTGFFTHFDADLPQAPVLIRSSVRCTRKREGPMSRWFAATVAAVVVCAHGADVTACGDKFLLLGRSIGYDKILKASRPGTVLIYSSPALPPAFGDGRFSALMELAGHHQHSVTDAASLEHALATGKIDLVVVDAALSEDIANHVRASSTALVVPVASGISGARRSELERKFGCVLSLPANARQVVELIDKAMALRAKRAAQRA